MTTTSFDADCIVVGSGPAGVSVTFPLVDAGRRVLMIDGATGGDSLANDFFKPWTRALGAQLEALVPEDGLSPKLRTPASRQIVGDFIQATNIRGEGFVAIGARARGGLSRIWGGFVCEFDERDIVGWPFSIADLRPSYKVVTDRIGVSGSDTDDMADFFGRSGAILPPLPIGSSAARLLKRYRAGSTGAEFALGVARNAILSVDRHDRQACDLRNDCLWGCSRGAVYDARFDLIELKRHETFHLVDGAFAIDLARSGGGWQISTQDGRRFSAPRIVLAAGALGTAALVIRLLPNTPTELRLLNSPVLAMPILVPARLGRSADPKAYSLAQLGYRLRYGSAPTDYITGAIYEVEGLPPSSFTARLPFSRRAGTDFFNAISPALLIATGYFPGTCSDNKLRWERHGDRISIAVRGGTDPELPSKLERVIRRLRKIWWQLGALMLPGTSLATPGTDVHYAGLFAMGHHTAHGSTMWGELHGAPGVYITDGAALPNLPSKHPTLTIMANADRIGRHLARIHSVEVGEGPAKCSQSPSSRLCDRTSGLRPSNRRRFPR